MKKRQEKLYPDFQKICKQLGWKCTSPRWMIYRFVYNNLNHPTVDEVWNYTKHSLPTITRESVYRILNDFSERGILQRLDHIDSARYDSQTGPHGHFICTRCGNIMDFPLTEDMTQFAAEIPGQIRQIELRISGICCACSLCETKKT